MRGFPQLAVLLLILLLPSQVVCGLCITGWCPMQAEPEAVKTAPAETAEPGGCHREPADHGSEDQAVITAAMLQPDCCAVAGEPEAETPAMLTASAGVSLIEAADGPGAAPEADAAQRSRWAPPPRHQPLYHLHSSLLI